MGPTFAVEIERSGRYEDALVASDSAVIELLRSLEGEPDVNLSIKDADSGAVLILAVDGPRWLIGAETGDERLEFVREHGANAMVQLLVGSQATDLQEQATLDFAAVMMVAEAWMTRSAPADIPGIGSWRTT